MAPGDWLRGRRRLLLVVWGLGLMVSGLLLLRVRATPAPPSPTRVGCQDLATLPPSSRVIVRSQRLGFECHGGEMRGRLHCDRHVFTAVSLPMCDVRGVAWVTAPSEVQVTVVGARRLAVRRLCAGCVFKDAVGLTPQRARMLHGLGVAVMLLGLAVLGWRVVAALARG